MPETANRIEKAASRKLNSGCSISGKAKVGSM